MENQNPQPQTRKVRGLVIFWARMVGWIIASCVIPIITFSVKFGLFTKNVEQTDSLGNVVESSSVSLNGWGIISCLVIGFTISKVIKEVIAAYPKYCLAKQCLSGFVKTVLPLAIGFFMCVFLDGVIHHVMFCLGVLAVCQAIAIPLNPLPKWRYEKTGVEEYNTIVSYVTNVLQNRTPDKKGP